MNERGISKQDLFATLPPEWPEPLLPAIRAHLAVHPTKVVVLDDDPTGTQTVHDIPVLTEWSEATLRAELQQTGPGFYLLTNSRAFPVEEACRINREIGERLSRVAAELRQDFIVVSRGDSTLRGHFPDEVEALGAALTAGRVRPPILLCPQFEAGGRHTIGDVHYVAEGDRLVPAAQTPFARDAVFGYRSSNLREWVVEKSRGRIGAEQITSLALADIRAHGPQGIAPQLLLADGAVCIANAAGARDLEVIVLAALLAEARGTHDLSHRRVVCRHAHGPGAASAAHGSRPCRHGWRGRPGGGRFVCAEKHGAVEPPAGRRQRGTGGTRRERRVERDDRAHGHVRRRAHGQ